MSPSCRSYETVTELTVLLFCFVSALEPSLDSNNPKRTSSSLESDGTVSERGLYRLLNEVSQLIFPDSELQRKKVEYKASIY